MEVSPHCQPRMFRKVRQQSLWPHHHTGPYPSLHICHTCILAFWLAGISALLETWPHLQSECRGTDHCSVITHKAHRGHRLWRPVPRWLTIRLLSLTLPAPNLPPESTSLTPPHPPLLVWPCLVPLAPLVLFCLSCRTQGLSG